MRSDNDGWDDGVDIAFDELREEHPEHPIQSIADLIPKDLLRAWEESDPPQPPPKQLKCGICFKLFMAKASWFCAKWAYSSICLDCADGNTLPLGFLAECKRPPVRQLHCPRCGITRGVEGTLRSNLWVYELNCPNCGEYALLHCRIRRTCNDCGEEFFVNERYPRRQCHKCAPKTSGPNPYLT